MCGHVPPVKELVDSFPVFPDGKVWEILGSLAQRSQRWQRSQRRRTRRSRSTSVSSFALFAISAIFASHFSVRAKAAPSISSGALRFCRDESAARAGEDAMA